MNDFAEKPRSVSPSDMAYEYHRMDMEVAIGNDEGDKHYHPHYHDHDVRIFVFGGGVQLRMGYGDWQLYERGDEIVIPSHTVHEARVEPTGWYYVAGRPKDAQHPFEEYPPPASPEG